MRISIFGMGYVGCVSAGCLAEMGHEIMAVEPSANKLELINRGQSPIIEAGMDELIARMVQTGRLRGTSDWSAAIQGSDMAIVCVGTPSRPNGSIDLSYVLRVCEQIGEALAAKKDYFTVVIRSTVVPGTVEEHLLPVLRERSQKQPGIGFGLCMNPEFLREGTSISDFYNPPKTIIGQWDEKSGERLAEIYKSVPAPTIRTSLRVAEMVKYTDNVFHALKVCFANEVGNICQSFEIDSHEVMDIFCMDTKLNLSPSYLKPGFAFGGSCLPKDLRSLSYQAKKADVVIPLISSILESNKQQVVKLINLLQSYKGRTMGFLGLSFKDGTDDLRESPIAEVIETMLGKGFKIRIYDPNVSLARLVGANKAYIEKEIPHLSDLLCSSIEDLISHSEVIVIANKNKEYGERLSHVTSEHVVVDLVRQFSPGNHPNGHYHGICW
jgi:GDP-mannose 6-dehydrogenase